MSTIQYNSPMNDHLLGQLGFRLIKLISVVGVIIDINDYND